MLQQSTFTLQENSNSTTSMYNPLNDAGSFAIFGANTCAPSQTQIKMDVGTQGHDQGSSETSQVRQPKKRAPKAPTMFAKDWKPYEFRIRELRIEEKKSDKEVQDIVNKEYGLKATERQYKAQIKRMGIQQPSTKKERQKILRTCQFRAQHLGKKTGTIRVRGHLKDSKTISRWERENPTSPNLESTPSPLPSYISIYTGSPPGTPKTVSAMLSEYQVIHLGSHTPNAPHPENADLNFMSRFFGHAQVQPRTVESCEARTIVNDIQSIISFNNIDHTNDTFAAVSWIEDTIAQVLNPMNLAQSLIVNDSSVGTKGKVAFVRNQLTDLKILSKQSTWMSPHARMIMSLWQVTKFSPTDNQHQIPPTSTCVKFMIVPIDSLTYPFYAVIDLLSTSSQLPLLPRISYHAIRPNDSEVFSIASYGTVQELMSAINEGIASLTDRDEQSRSLLNYAMEYTNVDMCAFLVNNNADVDGMEFGFDNFFGPVSGTLRRLASDCDERQLRASVQCTKITLDAGADPSIEMVVSNNIPANPFMVTLQADVRNVVEIGGAFINLNGTYRDIEGNFTYPLMGLAIQGGSKTSEPFETIEKAIFLLERKADFSCRDDSGDTVLHTLFRATDNRKYWSPHDAQRLLMVFISAGADIYAQNDREQTPSMIASLYGWKLKVWKKALILCGIEPNWVLDHWECNLHYGQGERQVSKLSFEDCCRRLRDGQCRFEEVETEDEDESEENSISDDDSIYSERTQDSEKFDELAAERSAGLAPRAEVGMDMNEVQNNFPEPRSLDMDWNMGQNTLADLARTAGNGMDWTTAQNNIWDLTPSSGIDADGIVQQNYLPEFTTLGVVEKQNDVPGRTTIEDSGIGWNEEQNGLRGSHTLENVMMWDGQQDAMPGLDIDGNGSSWDAEWNDFLWNSDSQ